MALVRAATALFHSHGGRVSCGGVERVVARGKRLRHPRNGTRVSSPGTWREVNRKVVDNCMVTCNLALPSMRATKGAWVIVSSTMYGIPTRRVKCSGRIGFEEGDPWGLHYPISTAARTKKVINLWSYYQV
jgi:hypothetical protein